MADNDKTKILYIEIDGKRVYTKPLPIVVHKFT